MYCRNCGNKLNDDWNVCPRCGTKVEKKVQNAVSKEMNSDTINIKRITLHKSWWVGIIIIIIVFIGVCLIRKGDQTREVEFGDPINVEDIVNLSLDEGICFEGAAYPEYAVVEEAGIQYEGEGTMFGIYGTVENLSSSKYDINEICDFTLIFDGKYEVNGDLWLENNERTEFQGFDIGDLISIDPDAVLFPKNQYYCVIIGQIGNAVYENAEEAELEIKVLKDITKEDKYITYRIPLKFEKNEDE
ncbi:zinc-ribbon domain-containing protein [Bariatricus sp. SGI.161]|uniref:zinc-ribbon domain-containing protein n=1 Tax=Bariatricus sp. SGI.161 TaxID=3420550 RepID=UPI003D069CAA